MKLTQEQIAHVVSEVESLDYGRVIVEINARTGHLDIITERRVRLRDAPLDRSRARK